MVRALAHGLVGMAAIVVLAACGSGTTISLMHAAAGLPSFYAVPSSLSVGKPPGTLLKWQRVLTPGLSGSSYRVMYMSLDEDKQPVPVTGLVFVPSVPIPRGGYPVVSWAHPTNGMTDQCAPSLDPETALPSVAALNTALDLGWEVAATDYQGEGTPPGILAYLAGDAAAYDTIDIVRAVRQLPLAHAARSYIVWGVSEGGQTAMFAWQLGDTYGSQSDLNLMGVVAEEPPSHLGTSFAELANGPYRYLILMAEVGLNAAYGNKTAPLDEVLTPTGLSLVPDMRKGCSDYIASIVEHHPGTQLFKANPVSLPLWQSLVTANDPAQFSTGNGIPLLLVQGGADAVVSASSTEALAQQLCNAGRKLEEWVYPGQTHSSTIVVSAEDVAHWISGRFNGVSPGSYVPTGEPAIQRTGCP